MMGHAIRTSAASVLTVLLATACGGGGTNNPTGECGESVRKSWVLDTVDEWYLFQDALPASIDPDDYDTAEDLLTALTAEAASEDKDRNFTYLTTQSAEEAALAGDNAGFGVRIRISDNEDAINLLEVFEDTPAEAAGLTRGTQIVAIDAEDGNGFVSVADWLAIDPELDTALGPSDEGVERRFRVLQNGATREVTMSKVIYTIIPVPEDDGVKILPLEGTAGVGYLNFRSFLSTSTTPLQSAFTTFRDAGVTDLIVDLRYNGGGLVRIARLLDNLMGEDLSGNTSYIQQYNDAKSGNNLSYTFVPQSQSVAPVRIAFITSGSTASASELVINSMDPWIQVAIVGSNTYGKPVGQSGFDLDNCDDRLRVVTFRTVNAIGTADYYTGLASTVPYACAASDDIDHTMGDVDESSTAEAMQWLSSGSCTTAMSTTKAAVRSSPLIHSIRTPAEELFPDAR